ncbi:hypothetical protein BN7_2325 [Wickerhamomyces ciferrii]|uniref:Uncharacterized protein n=1 Tax=Wickerhamomyces ciferrii (strain ATCC 14091 / BCRC 22168 / CBS 111 / JCM 3599 / NBRC 0793 / NRRL Y-1031 F-60-10) TaxID=1206466 RepID=K0KII2_WICCF|nr:uncharacterized protein BN7_2325 [Wickerhamomyces ciferrii]CCH42781.1 hypothetical protein BN7_2325 [Wickerhamomyces ciferrii]
MAIKLIDITKDPKTIVKNGRGLIPLGLILLLLVSTWVIYPSNSQVDQDALKSNDNINSNNEEQQINSTIKNFTNEPSLITFENASAIFNTINSALKPKHSQIHPIGVSFIPAVIPEGSLLYHGNTDGNIPTGLEWIAMDPEFSYWFIANRDGPGHNGTFPGKPGGPGGPGGPGKPPGGPDGPGGPPPDGPGGKDPKYKSPNDPSHKSTEKGKEMENGKDSNKLGGGITGGGGKHHGKPSGSTHSSLLTFQVKKPLDRMILLDGSSGAKSHTGEMDTQMILAKAGVNETINEYEAAERICKWGEPFGLDGFIRIEIGFEAIICDFQNDKLELVSNVTIGWKQEAIGFPLEKDYIEEPVEEIIDSLDAMAGFEFMNQGNAHSKRDRRIELDYKGLVTPLNKTWIHPDPYLRRVNDINDDLKNELIENLENYLKTPIDTKTGTDWQFITDEIIDKFTPILETLNNSLSKFSKNDVDEDTLIKYAKNSVIYTNNFVRRFKDYQIKDENEQIQTAKKFAIYQFSHPLTSITTESEHLIYSSVSKVVSEIVDFIFELNTQSIKILKTAYSDKQSVLKYSNVMIAASKNLTNLLNTLNWVEFYQCDRKCNSDELCYIPSWGPSPFGWSGKDLFGTEAPGEGQGQHSRIKNPLQCISYKTILEQRNHKHA